MKAQHLFLYAIIRKRHTQLLKPEIMDFFNNNTSEKKILESCFFIRMEGKQPTVDEVKNWISTNVTKQSVRNAILQDVTTITAGEKYIDLGEIERHLELEFYNEKWAEINNTLTDQSATLEMKKDVVRRASEVINRTQKTDDFQSIKKILMKSHADNVAGRTNDLMKNSIELQDINLIKIFGKHIWGMPHLILARPNSYKTTFLYNIMYELSKLGKQGIIASLEDTSEMASIKLMSVISKMCKVELITGKYIKPDFEKHLANLKDNIFVMDKIRTPNELYVDLKNKLMTRDINYVAVDFIQGVKKDRYQTDTEKIQQLTEVLFELNKEYKIPIFQLSQAPKSNVADSKMLGMGNEKGASEIAEKSRWSCSLNPCGGNEPHNPYEQLIINIYKTTLSPKGQVKIEFHKQSGQIESTEILDG